MRTVIRNEVNKITKDDFNYGYYLDRETFICEIKISEKLQSLLGADKPILEAEYWLDDNSYHYLIHYVDEETGEVVETTNPNDSLVCKHLNNLMASFIEEH